MMSSLRLPPFRLVHAAYVTHDIESGKRRLADMFGVEEFWVYPEIEVEVPGGAAKIAFALATSSGTALEVIKPTGGKDDVYRQELPDDPTDIAFHHFATRLENEAEWQMVLDAAREHGLDIPVRGGGDSGTRYIYLDTRVQLGHMLEFMLGFDEGTSDNAAVEVRHERIG